MSPNDMLNATGKRVYDAIRQVIGNAPTCSDADALALAVTFAVQPVFKTLCDEARDRDVVEVLGEQLFDAAHEGCCCDDGPCGGGGRPWYDLAAARLVKASVLGEVAVELQLRDDRREQPKGAFPEDARPDFIRDAADAIAQVEAIDRRHAEEDARLAAR